MLFFFFLFAVVFFFFFFFQAEDGIRDRNVTGVQTCALPILGRCSGRRQRRAPFFGSIQKNAATFLLMRASRRRAWVPGRGTPSISRKRSRSEERRVGKEWRSRWWA